MPTLIRKTKVKGTRKKEWYDLALNLDVVPNVHISTSAYFRSSRLFMPSACALLHPYFLKKSLLHIHEVSRNGARCLIWREGQWNTDKYARLSVVESWARSSFRFMRSQSLAEGRWPYLMKAEGNTVEPALVTTCRSRPQSCRLRPSPNGPGEFFLYIIDMLIATTCP